MPPDPPIFFTDRNLGLIFPRYLQQHNIHVKVHDEYFTPQTVDEEWLKAVGRNGWYVLSLDKRIRYNPAEKEAVITYNVGLFILGIKNITIMDLANHFVKIYPRVCRFINRTSRPFIARIYKSGSIKMAPIINPPAEP